MAKCGECSQFFAIPETASDYEQGKADCVREQEDQKGKYWISKPVTFESAGCDGFKQR